MSAVLLGPLANVMSDGILPEYFSFKKQSIFNVWYHLVAVCNAYMNGAYTLVVLPLCWAVLITMVPVLATRHSQPVTAISQEARSL
jgi:hypothetical protein